MQSTGGRRLKRKKKADAPVRSSSSIDRTSEIAVGGYRPVMARM